MPRWLWSRLSSIRNRSTDSFRSSVVCAVLAVQERRHGVLTLHDNEVQAVTWSTTLENGSSLSVVMPFNRPNSALVFTTTYTAPGREGSDVVVVYGVFQVSVQAIGAFEAVLVGRYGLTQRSPGGASCQQDGQVFGSLRLIPARDIRSLDACCSSSFPRQPFPRASGCVLSRRRPQ